MSGSGPKELTMVSDLLSYTGYGNVAQEMAIAFDHAQYRLNLVPLVVDHLGLDPQVSQLLERSVPDLRPPILFYGWLRPAVRALQRHEHYVNTMCESSRLPKSWVPLLDKASSVIVPSTFCASAFRASGISRPIVVIPEGVNPAHFPFAQRTPRTTFTGLIVGAAERRKHLDESIAAWQAAFPGDESARLIVKVSRGDLRILDRFHTEQVRFISTRQDRHSILDLYANADVLLSLGSEGFGLPPIEAMCTGLPVVLMDSEGQQDLCRDAQDFVVAVRSHHQERVEIAEYGPCGYQHVPDISEAASALRWVRSNWTAGGRQAISAAEWAARHRSIERKVSAIDALLSARSAQLDRGRPLDGTDQKGARWWTPVDR